MASIKISELNEKTNLIDNDLVAVVDSVADETKKMTYGNLKTQIINDNFAVLTAVGTGTTGFIKFNYPDGWTYENCVVISYSVLINNVQRTIYPSTIDLNNSMTQTIVMYSYGIRGIEIGPQVQDGIYTIVLMKVA